MFNKTNDVRKIQYYNRTILIVRQHNRKLYFDCDVSGKSLLRLNRVLKAHYTITDCVIGKNGVTILYAPKES